MPIRRKRAVSRPLPLDAIRDRILIVRGHKVLLDSDLATLYGVETRRLNEQVRRNIERFPADFLIQLKPADVANLMSQNATSSWGGRRKRPFAFTEHGAIMAASVLNAPRAIEMSVFVVRAFVALRETAADIASSSISSKRWNGTSTVGSPCTTRPSPRYSARSAP